MPTSGSASLRRSRFWQRVKRDAQYSDGPLLAVLTGVLLLVVGAGIAFPEVVPIISVLVPMFLASQFLGPRTLPWFVIASLLGTCVLVVFQPATGTRAEVRLGITFLIGLLILFSSFRRSRLGVAGPRGESMLVDLRDRIMRQSEIPGLPADWYAGSVLRSAGGTLFAGDFIVATLTEDRRHLHVAVVDVSGKGVEAGTRSLLLSGAFGGIMSSTTPEGFLPAANDFLLRQEWDEGFATAIHLDLDLDSGDFEVRKAGHPPAVWMHAGSGGWTVLESDGPVLGLIEGAQFESRRGGILPGDALLLYTDGLVEDPRKDIGSGIDKLAGSAHRLFQTGFEHGEATMVDRLERDDDDRALLLVHHRRPGTPVTEQTR